MQTLERCGLLGAVVGSDVMEERIRSATETAKRPVDGMQTVHFKTGHFMTSVRARLFLSRFCSRGV